MASRGLRTRPSPASSSQPTSNRSGLRNSSQLYKDSQLAPPPAKRRRYSDGQESRRVHVSATSPNLVIAGIRSDQWPFATASSQPQANGRRRGRSAESPLLNGHPRQSRSQPGTSRSPLKRRAVRDESYAEYNTDDSSSDHDSERSLHGSPANRFQPEPQRDTLKARSPHLASLDTNGIAFATDAHIAGDPSVSEDEYASDSTDDTVAPAADLTPSKNDVMSLDPSPSPLEQPGTASVIEPHSAQSRSPKPARLPDELPRNLPDPFMQRQSTPPQFADEAARLYHQQFAPLTDPAAFLDLLTSHAPASRSVDTLWHLAAATHKALVTWQDEYLALDTKTAPKQHPPKKVASGGRQPLDQKLAENAKEIELYGHILGVEGTEYPAAKRGAYAGLGYDPPAATKPSAAAEFPDGRRPRRRGADAKLTDGIQLSEPEQGRNEKRARKPVRRFDVGSNEHTGRKRRRLVPEGDEDDSGSDFDIDADAAGPRKRGRLGQVFGQDGLEASAMSPGEDDFTDHTPRPSQARAGAGRGRGARGRGGRGRGQVRIANGGSQREHTPAAAAQPSSIAVQPTSSGAATVSSQSKATKPKSEKRSNSMTAWWAERKRRQEQERLLQRRELGTTNEFSASVPQPPSSSAPAMQVAPQPVPATQMSRDHAPENADAPFRQSYDVGRPSAAGPPPQPQSQTTGYAPQYHHMHTQASVGAHHPLAMGHILHPQDTYQGPQHPQWYPNGYPPMPPPPPKSSYPHGQSAMGQPPAHLVPQSDYRIMNAR